MRKNNYYCYDVNMHKYLHYEKKFEYVVAARHENTYEKFWLYERTPELSDAISEFKRMSNT